MIEENKSKISYIQVLKRQGFRNLWIGSAISIIGNHIHYIAMLAYVYHLTGKALDLGFLMIISAIPNLIFGPFMGVLADRLNRRYIMIVSDLARCAFAFIFPFTATLWQIYALVFLMGIARTAYSPAEFSLLPNLVKKDELVVANSLEVTTMNITMIVGPALGGLIISIYGTTPAFIANALTFLFSAVMISFIREILCAEKSEERKTGIFSDFKEGLSFLWGDSIMRYIIIVFSIVVILVAGINPLIIVYVHKTLGKGDIEFGYLISILGVGGIVGGFLYGLIGKRVSKMQVMIYNLLIDGMVMCFLGFTSSYYFAGVIFFIFGMINTAFHVAVMTLLQEYIPNNLRGRIIGVFSLIFDPLRMFSMGIYGFLADIFSVGILFIASGLFEVLTGGFARLMPAYRKIRGIEGGLFS
ncbi:MAG: MFS transporter [bacterium]